MTTATVQRRYSRRRSALVRVEMYGDTGVLQGGQQSRQRRFGDRCASMALASAAETLGRRVLEFSKIRSAHVQIRPLGAHGAWQFPSAGLVGGTWASRTTASEGPLPARGITTSVGRGLESGGDGGAGRRPTNRLDRVGRQRGATYGASESDAADELPRSNAALPDECQPEGIHGDIGAALVDHADHAQGGRAAGTSYGR